MVRGSPDAEAWKKKARKAPTTTEIRGDPLSLLNAEYWEIYTLNHKGGSQ